MGNFDTGPQSEVEFGNIAPINVKRSRYPFCLVWTTIPLLSWFLPLIGHLGICDSQGIIYDFAGPYTVTADNFAFGKPFKYKQLPTPEQINNPEFVRRWDSAIEKSSRSFSSQMYSLFINNCHSFVAGCLNRVRYRGKSNWNMFSVWKVITFEEDIKFVSGLAIFRTYGYLPIVGLGFLIVSLVGGSVVRHCVSS